MEKEGGILGPLRVKSLQLADISMTDNYDFVADILMQNPYPNPIVKVVDMEDSPQTLPKEHPNVIGGGVLLPPIDALIAEQDGDENKYDRIYLNYFHEEYVSLFMEALISALLLGTNLILYLPNKEQFQTPRKFAQVVEYLYGIRIGVIGQRPSVCNLNDISSVKCWLCAAYRSKAITPREFLYLYPGDIDATPEIISKLIMDINPMDENPMPYLNKLSRQLKEKPDLIVPLFRDNTMLYWGAV